VSTFAFHHKSSTGAHSPSYALRLAPSLMLVFPFDSPRRCAAA